jgi:hypothetical protein
MMKLEFMDVYETPDLIRAAERSYDNVKAVFLQNDTLDVHFFVLYRDGDQWYAAMGNCEKPSKTRLPNVTDIVDAIEDGYFDEEQEYSSMEEALDNIVSGYKFHGQTEELTELVASIEEKEKFSRMSKYAKKKYLRDHEDPTK